MLVKNIVATLDRFGIARVDPEAFDRNILYRYEHNKNSLEFEKSSKGHAVKVYYNGCYYGTAGQALYDFITASTRTVEEINGVRVIRGVEGKNYTPYVFVGLSATGTYEQGLTGNMKDMPTPILLDWLQDQGKITL